MPGDDAQPELHVLSLSRTMAAAPAAVYRAWTDPTVLTRWFAPAPWTTAHAELDVRPGGCTRVEMRSPEGQAFPTRGVYLEVVPDRRLVFTDAYVDAWTPSAKPFMTVILTFEPEGDGTRYTAEVRHWTAEDRAQHAAMGFEVGWGMATDQLAAVAARL